MCQSALLCCLGNSSLGDSSWSEYRLKANFLAMSTNFVEWPAEATASVPKPFALCVYGDFPFGPTLAELTRATNVHGSRVEVKWVRKEPDLRNCNLVFVSRSEEKRYARILQTLWGTSILTVGETPGFLEAGGILDLDVQSAKLHFDVNLEAAEVAHLKISARLLALARRVIGSARALQG